MLMIHKDQALEVHKEFGRGEKLSGAGMFQGRAKNKRRFFLSIQAFAKFAGMSCFVLPVGQEDRGAGGGVDRQYLSPQGMEGGRVGGGDSTLRKQKRWRDGDRSEWCRGTAEQGMVEERMREMSSDGKGRNILDEIVRKSAEEFLFSISSDQLCSHSNFCPNTWI